MEESQKDTIDTLRFEDLDTQKQIEYFNSVYKKISQILYNEYRNEFIHGQKEIYDFTFNRSKNGQIIYTIMMKDKEKNKTTLHFSDNLTQLDLPEDQIKAMRLMNYDVTSLNQKKSELLFLDEGPNKISLSELKSLDKEIDTTCAALNMTKEELSYAAVIDSDNKVKLDPNEINGIKSDMIDGGEKISTYYRMNDITGMNYDKYQIIKTQTGFPIILGITKDGLAEKIDSKFQLLNDVNTMTLMQQNGTTEKVSVVAAFRIKSQSDVDKDQVIGLCNDSTSQMTAFYARGAITADKMIGEDIPCNVYCEHRVQQEKVMDARTNKDISGEADSMDIRTDNGSVVQTSMLNEQSDLNELIDQSSTECGVNPEALRKKVMEALSDAKNNDKTDKEIVEKVAVMLNEEEYDAETSNGRNKSPEHGEPVLGRGNPFGNINVDDL